MIRIICHHTSPRLEYIAGVLFRNILGVDYEILLLEDFPDWTAMPDKAFPTILYGIPSADFCSIPDTGLLFENTIREINYSLIDDPFPKLHFGGEISEGLTVDFDLFSAAFYLLTSYSYYDLSDGSKSKTGLDMHGRYDENTDPLFLKGYHKQPLIDIYARFLWETLQKFMPGIEINEERFDYKISFDIDSPFLFKEKGFWVSTLSMIKRILKFDVQTLFLQIRVLLGKHDPYDVFEEIKRKVPAQNLLFFFLINRNHKNDTRITYKNKAYQDIIFNLTRDEIEIGIHPSYTSYMDPKLIRFEKDQLEKICQKEITSNRMHFLKYHLPETFQYLAEAGFKDDYTLCLVNDCGFKNFIARPFPWYNLPKNEATDLILHPTMVMDRTLQKYMALSPTEAWNNIKEMIDLTKSFNGVFTILFHNDSLSETGEWKGWKMVFDNTVSYLKKIAMNDQSLN